METKFCKYIGEVLMGREGVRGKSITVSHIQVQISCDEYDHYIYLSCTSKLNNKENVAGLDSFLRRKLL